MKMDRPGLISLVYGLFVLLYACYIILHPAWFKGGKGAHWGYLLAFLFVSNLVFFIVQGIVLRSRNWGIIFLLPLVLFVAIIIVGYSLVGLVRLGGGDLLNRDRPDMFLATLLLLAGTFYSLRWIRPGKRKKAR